MLLDELARDPDDGHRVEACCVGDDLAQVGVIGLLELVLDEHPPLAHGVLTQDVGGERPDTALGGLELERHAQRLAEQLEVLLLRQPGREMRCLIRPCRTQVDPLQTAEFHVRHPGSSFSRSPTLYLSAVDAAHSSVSSDFTVTSSPCRRQATYTLQKRTQKL